MHVLEGQPGIIFARRVFCMEMDPSPELQFTGTGHRSVNNLAPLSFHTLPKRPAQVSGLGRFPEVDRSMAGRDDKDQRPQQLLDQAPLVGEPNQHQCCRPQTHL